MLQSTITDGFYPKCSQAFGTYTPDDLIGFTPNVITKVGGDLVMAPLDQIERYLPGTYPW